MNYVDYTPDHGLREPINTYLLESHRENRRIFAQKEKTYRIATKVFRTLAVICLIAEIPTLALMPFYPIAIPLPIGIALLTISLICFGEYTRRQADYYLD